jgi:cytochrome b6-f complex iron-sulfur subunit
MVVYQVAQAPANFRTQSGVYELDPTILRHGPPPIPFRDARAWLILSETGLCALFADCPHRSSIPCTPQWVDVNNRFECPCYGSKFQLDGTYISGPAPRGLDHLVIHAETPHGIIHTPEDGSPIPIDDATRLSVDTRTKIPGQPRE